MSEESTTTQAAPSREWTKFVILAVILLGTILVVALARPFIFNFIVPTVMGEGQLTAPMPVDVEEAYPAEDEQPGAAPIIEEAYPGEAEQPGAAPEAADEPDPAGEENEMAAEELPTAVTTISHTVQRGDTILSIARRYEVTVDDIVKANNITNPNHIEVGTTLLVPQP
jgi:nucleoid-associated protein YgaU